MDLSSFAGVLGNLIAVLLFLSPIKTFSRIVRKRSTEEFESTPYIITLLSTSLWTYYGIMKLPGALPVVTINGFGTVVELVYVSLFLMFASSTETRARTMLFVILDAGFLVTAILISRFLLNGDDHMRIHIIGFLCATLNILVYASPLSALRAVVTTESVEYMPFLLFLCVFLNSGVWTFYAFLIRDFFIIVPNAVGVILGATQLVVYAIYWRQEGQQQDDSQEPLIPSSQSHEAHV